MKNSFARLKLACYSVNVTMAIMGNLPPLLFITFRELYGISYTLLGLLVLINFSTQLAVDLIFSFFSHKFNIPRTVKLTPFIAFVGLVIFALAPIITPGMEYAGIVLGTVIFSAASGLAEVLISPVIAAIPSDDPDREMSKLHAVYAWGVVPVIVIGTLFLLFFGNTYWQLLVLLFTIVPLFSFILYIGVEIPKMETPERVSGAVSFLKNKALWLCVGAIFLGGASECTMAQWASGYLEQALLIPKAWGDILGVALFAVTLGIGRTMYSKIGRNIYRVLFVGACGATACYLICAVTPYPVLGLVACALTGLCVSMMWPGSLIVSSEKFPAGGVFIFAMMASGGDLGASVGPQLVGIVTDTVMSVPGIENVAARLSLAPEQLGMKLGMLVGMLFPLAAIFLYLYIMKTKDKK